MKKRQMLLAAVFLFNLAGCAFFNLPLIPSRRPLQEKVIAGYGPDKVLLLDISGTISMQSKSQLGGLSREPSLVARVKEELNLAQNDPRVKAIVLKINSPGGMVTASDILHHEILALKKRRGVKVVACLLELGASGAYYVATAADRIIAHPTTITGSIGVMVLKLSLADLLQKIGVREETVKSGEKKDLLFPYRSLSAPEREVVQRIVDHLQERFMQVIRRGRPQITAAQLREIADGRILTARQAKELGLIDRIGYLDDAVETARELAGLGEISLISYQSPYDPQPNIYTQAKQMSPQQPVSNLYSDSLFPGMSPCFMYLWLP